MASLRNYTVAVYEAEEGGFWADVLDLPGCVAQGETVEELEGNARDAIQAWEETRSEIDGEPMPRPVYTMTILTELPDDAVPA